jgi:hypothetical protein
LLGRRTDVVVFVFPGATVLCACSAREARVVFVCPGAVMLLPRDLTAAVVFVCPGAVLLLPCKTPAPAVAFRPRTRARCAGPDAFATRAANALAGNAGRRSEVVGFRGSGSFASGGGPWEARIT